MHVVILPEDERHHMAVIINNWKRVELVFPDNIVGFREAESVMRGYYLVDWGHEVADFSVNVHPAHTVITARYDAQQFPVETAVMCYGYCSVPCLVLERENV